MRILKARLSIQIARLAEALGRILSGFVQGPLAGRAARRRPGENAYEMAKRLKLIGCVKNAPSDLATNPTYFENFGRS